MKSTVYIRILLLLLGIHLSVYCPGAASAKNGDEEKETTGEHLYVYLDKTTYLTGEDCWIALYAVAPDLTPSTLSRVGYIEICDTRKPWIQLKLALEEGYGSGRIRIPHEMPSGQYRLTAYTRYMRNGGDERLFHCPIAIINMTPQARDGRIELLAPGEKRRAAVEEPSNIRIEISKPIYSTREKVSFRLSGLPERCTGLVVSVVRDDSITILPPVDKNAWRARASIPLAAGKWEAEYEGHILSAVRNEKIKSLALGFVGKDNRYIQGKIDEEANNVKFYANNLFGTQEVVVVTDRTPAEAACELSLLSPFREALPQSLPLLSLHGEDPHLQERYLAVQLREHIEAKRMDSLLTSPAKKEDSYYNLTPLLSYDLDEYTRFPTMNETFVEFVRRIVVRRIEGKQRIKVFSEEEKRYNAGNTLVLLDGVPIHNHEEILTYNPRLVKKIDIYGSKYVFGSEVYDCIVSFITHRANLAGFKLNGGSQLFLYECPTRPVSFSEVNHDTAEAEVVPDLRHTLFWNPQAGANIESGRLEDRFYTSDVQGTFLITVSGIGSNGEMLHGTMRFRVTNP